MEAASRVLAELCLEDFEPAFNRLGVESLEQLACIRFEELLEIGLSKVQCHLFIAKVSSLAAGTGSALVETADEAEEGDVRVMDVQDPRLAEELAACAAREQDGGATGPNLLDMTWAVQRELAAQGQLESARRAALRMQMPPPITSSPAPEAPRSRKRAHSSHLSTAAARGGSSHLSTAERRTGSSASGRASGSSSSSLHQDVRVKKRRVFERYCSGSGPRGDELERDRRADEEMPTM